MESKVTLIGVIMVRLLKEQLLAPSTLKTCFIDIFGSEPSPSGIKKCQWTGNRSGQ